MPKPARLGWLFVLTSLTAQEPATQVVGAPDLSSSHVVALQASVTTSIRAIPVDRPAVGDPAASDAPVPPVAAGATEPTPPAPADNRFAVPEAQTLLIVGAGLVLVALAKRRVRVSPVVMRRL